MCSLPLKWSQFLRWLHCNQLPEIGYTVSLRNPAVLKAVWYLNKQVICWGAETLFRALHGSGVFVTRLGFYYTQATGRVLCFLNKMTSFLELHNSSFSFSSPLLKSHFFPWIFHLKTQPILTKTVLKIQGCLLVACGLPGLLDFLMPVCVINTDTVPKNSPWEEDSMGTCLVPFFPLHVIYLLRRGLHTCVTWQLWKLEKKNCGSPFSPSTHGSFKTRTQVCKLGSNHLCSQRNLARSALLYFPFPAFFSPVPGTPMSYLISATLRVSVNISAYLRRKRDFRDTICPASLNRCLHMHWNSNEGNFISNPCSTVSSQTSHVSEVWPCSFEDVKPVAAS